MVLSEQPQNKEREEVVHLPVDQIMVPEERVTSVVDDETMAELRESIKQHGILQPLLVAKVDGRYILIDGLHRMIVAKELGMKTVPCVVKEMSEDELLITNLIVNRQRGRSNPADEARLVKLLIDQYQYSKSKVAETLGMSPSTVDKYYQIATRCSQRCLDALKAGLLSVGCAYWFSFLDDIDKQNELVEAALHYGYTVEQCKEAAKALSTPEYEPPPGSWTFDEDLKPKRVPVKAFPCLDEVDPSEVIYIPIWSKKADEVKMLFEAYCAEFSQQPQNPEGSTTVETSTPVEEQAIVERPAKGRENADWWPF